LPTPLTLPRLQSASNSGQSAFRTGPCARFLFFSPTIAMALKSTIFRANLTVSDLDRGHFAEHILTLARHPSETDERMMVRVLAFALNADERLQFGRGISTVDEPALWLRDDTGREIEWIEVGLPDERLLRRACGRADQVIVFAYGGRVVDIWWQKDAATLGKLNNLKVLSIAPEDSKALAALAERNMDLGCTIQDGEIWFSSGDTTLTLTLRTVYPQA
jgi:uncharacterized protein YaeQ